MPIGFAEPWTEAVLSLFSALEHTLGRYDNTTVIKIQHEKCDLKMISLNRMESAIRAVVDHYEMSLFAQQTEDVLGGCGQICVKGVTDKGESTVAAFPSSLPKDCQILSCEERHLLRLLESLRHCLRKYMPCPTQGPYFPQSNCTATSSFMGQLSQNALYTSSLHLARLQLPTPCITGLYATLSVTNELVEQVKITLNRRSARAALGYHLEGATPYTIGKEDTMRYEYLPQQRLAASLFGQTFSLVGAMSADLFQTRSRLWSVAFTGEGADDVGGPYRECIGGICAELMSDALPLFRATANRRHNVGDFRDRFTVNPYPIRDLSTISARGNDDTSLFTPECSDEPFVSNCKLCINVLMMYEFFGKLIGGCLRSNEPLPLYLSPSIWQYLVSPTGEHHLISSNLSEIDDEDTDLLSPKTVLVLQETTALEDIHYYETIQYFKRHIKKYFYQRRTIWGP